MILGIVLGKARLWVKYLKFKARAVEKEVRLHMARMIFIKEVIKLQSIVRMG